MPEFVIQTQNLSKSYKNFPALKNLTLNVPEHSIFGFLGPNGAGKTTTMKLLLGLLRPTSGSATVFGYDILKNSVDLRARLGYLPQEPRFYEYLTARETLDFVARFFFKGPNPEIKKRVQETLELVGLEEKADRKISTFSGGERQRLGIAQAQVNYPDLIILDEPAASLDPLGRRDVLNVLERLRKHTTVFYSTHILDDVQQVSDTVAILNRGELVANGPIQELLSGTSGVVYRVQFEGESSQALANLRSLPWVTQVQETQVNTSPAWLISVSDEQAAKENLLRLLVDSPGMLITEFGRKRYELEEIFISIVEGGQNVRE